jgi:hypothetical protein
VFAEATIDIRDVDRTSVRLGFAVFLLQMAMN